MINDFARNPHRNTLNTTLLFFLALTNYALMYGANIMLVHTLDVGEFDDYSVAVSTVTMMSTIATLGLEKYALWAIPAFLERQDWERFRGFWLFSLRTIFGFSFLLMASLGLSLEAVLAFYQSDYHISIVVFACFLPVIALSLYLVEYISAYGMVLLSVSIYRFLLPVFYLFFLIVVSVSLARLTALIAVICLGMAWIVVLLLLWRTSVILIPAAAQHTAAAFQGKSWLGASLPLVMNSMMMTVMTSAGVVIMELLFPSSVEVGMYAVAAQTGGIISLVGTSTNRYYLPMIVSFTVQRNKASIYDVMKKRTLTVGGLILLLLSSIFWYGKAILALFSAHFVTGYDTLVIIAVGASISALYADIPYYLQFMGYKRTVINLTGAATLTMIALSVWLGPVYGSAGVATAYMATVSALFISLRIIAALHLRRL